LAPEGWKRPSRLPTGSVEREGGNYGPSTGRDSVVRAQSMKKKASKKGERKRK